MSLDLTLTFDGQAYIQTMVTPKGLLWLTSRYPADPVPVSPFRAAVAQLERQ